MKTDLKIWKEIWKIALRKKCEYVVKEKAEILENKMDKFDNFQNINFQDKQIDTLDRKIAGVKDTIGVSDEKSSVTISELLG